MSTAVLDLELTRFPGDVTGVEGYQAVLFLVRVHGRPIGQVRLPAARGRVAGEELWDAALQAGGDLIWEAWLHDYLEWDAAGPAERPLPAATVAVCTRDRPDDLRRCLDALMRLPDHGQEVLVVDSCSAGPHTRQVAEQFGERVRYVREDRPGLNVARNRALREGRYGIVAFTDDDAVPDPCWLAGLLRNFDDPLVQCVTGLTVPLELETEAQELNERYSSFGRGFRRAVFDGWRFPPGASGRVGAGVNMAVRREVLDLFGPFDEALDAGTLTCSGGDNEMFARILAAGYRIVYEPRALSRHRHRRTRAELRRAFYGYGVGVYAAWTRSLLQDREFSLFKPAWRWLWRHQVRGLLRKRSSAPPRDLKLALLRGCLAGPWAYLRARWQRNSG